MSDMLARLSTVLAERHRLEREIGAGGTATVQLAQDLRHDRMVAVKVPQAGGLQLISHSLDGREQVPRQD